MCILFIIGADAEHLHTEKLLLMLYSYFPAAMASANFSKPACNGFEIIPLTKGLRSDLMVSFILQDVGEVGSNCTHRLNGSGDVTVSYFMVLGASLSQMRIEMSPTGGTFIVMESLSKMMSSFLSSGSRSLTC